MSNSKRATRNSASTPKSPLLPVKIEKSEDEEPGGTCAAMITSGFQNGSANLDSVILEVDPNYSKISAAIANQLSKVTLRVCLTEIAKHIKGNYAIRKKKSNPPNTFEKSDFLRGKWLCNFGPEIINAQVAFDILSALGKNYPKYVTILKSPGRGALTITALEPTLSLWDISMGSPGGVHSEDGGDIEDDNEEDIKRKRESIPEEQLPKVQKKSKVDKSANDVRTKSHESEKLSDFNVVDPNNLQYVHLGIYDIRKLAMFAFLPTKFSLSELRTRTFEGTDIPYSSHVELYTHSDIMACPRHIRNELFAAIDKYDKEMKGTYRAWEARKDFSAQLKDAQSSDAKFIATYNAEFLFQAFQKIDIEDKERMEREKKEKEERELREAEQARQREEQRIAAEKLRLQREQEQALFFQQRRAGTTFPLLANSMDASATVYQAGSQHQVDSQLLGTTSLASSPLPSTGVALGGIKPTLSIPPSIPKSINADQQVLFELKELIGEVTLDSGDMDEEMKQALAELQAEMLANERAAREAAAQAEAEAKARQKQQMLDMIRKKTAELRIVPDLPANNVSTGIAPPPSEIPKSAQVDSTPPVPNHPPQIDSAAANPTVPNGSQDEKAPAESSSDNPTAPDLSSHTEEEESTLGDIPTPVTPKAKRGRPISSKTPTPKEKKDKKQKEQKDKDEKEKDEKENKEA